MANLLLELANQLAELDWITGDGVDVFRDYKPDTPDAIVVLQEYRGSGSEWDAIGTRPIQVLVRHPSADTARDRANLIYRFFFADKEELLEESEVRAWYIMSPINPPFLLERDEKERPMYVFNMIVTTTID